MLNPRFKNSDVDTQEALGKLSNTISHISIDPGNWIVSEINHDSEGVARVEFKPLDVSSKCQELFQKGDKVLLMSATILSKDIFCREVGLAPDEVKFIQVDSTFPADRRPIYQWNICSMANGGFNSHGSKIIEIIDKLMTIHKTYKCLILITSYDQLNYIMANISEENRKRLIATGPDKDREDVVNRHIYNPNPTVLMSPSLYLGIDLKGDLSRFAIIMKIPYPNLGDRWIDKKRNKSGQDWYNWQTCLNLVQGYGRSVRSKEDWAYCHVLDSGFWWFIQKDKDMIPDWFTEAIQND